FWFISHLAGWFGFPKYLPVAQPVALSNSELEDVRLFHQISQTSSKIGLLTRMYLNAPLSGGLSGGVTQFVVASLTGIGGGMLRDVLVVEIPVVLRADLYAPAALTGAIVVVTGPVFHVSPIATTTL